MSKNANVDLVKLFGQVASNLLEEKDALNKADTYNNDHGDNMVKTFQAIASAVQEKQEGSPAEQLAYAGDVLSKSKSGSAQVYANGLAQASQQLAGKGAIDAESANVLMQSLLGGGVEQPEGVSAGGDLLGSLLGGLGGGADQAGGAGLDVGDLLNAGLAFMNAKQEGDSTAEAAISALLAAGPLGQSEHRKQSGTIVANTLMQMLGSAMSGK